MRRRWQSMKVVMKSRWWRTQTAVAAVWYALWFVGALTGAVGLAVLVVAYLLPLPVAYALSKRHAKRTRASGESDPRPTAGAGSS
jgi:hypothetical protein